MYEQGENKNGANIINVREVISMKPWKKLALAFLILYSPPLAMILWWAINDLIRYVT